MMNFESILQFGKYSGLTVRAIARFDAGYLVWAEANLSHFTISGGARQAIHAEAGKDHARSLERQNGWAWGFGGGAKSSADRDRSRRIKIEHEERRKAGQTTCHCFPYNTHCDDCHRTGWIVAPLSPAAVRSAPSVNSLSGPANSAPDLSGDHAQGIAK